MGFQRLSRNQAIRAQKRCIKSGETCVRACVHVVEKAEDISVGHLTDADDDRQLHLVSVEPRDFVPRQLPNLLSHS